MTNLSDMFVELSSRNTGPDHETGERTRPNYRIVSTIDADLISVTLTFVTGSSYCCAEPGCHLPFSARGWARVRDALADRGIRPESPLRVHVTGVIEAGALFFDLMSPDTSKPGWYSFKPSEAATYTSTFHERSSVP